MPKSNYNSGGDGLVPGLVVGLVLGTYVGYKLHKHAHSCETHVTIIQEVTVPWWSWFF